VSDQEQEERWARELHAARLKFIARVKLGVSMSSPTRRRALYQDWRKELGDDIARESAKYVEAVFEGRRKISELEKMVK
jgi:hypothetical protein